MDILYSTPKLRTLTLLWLLSLPIFFLNLWVLQKGDPTRKLLQEYALLAKPQLLLIIELAFLFLGIIWLKSAKKISFFLVLGWSMFCVTSNLHFLIKTKNYALAFFIIFLLILCTSYLQALYQTLAQPFYNSKKRWFEGLPSFLPKLEGLLTFKDPYIEITPLKFSSLEETGCFTYSTNSDFLVPIKKLPKKGLLQLKSDDLELKCDVHLVSKDKKAPGWGLCFNVKNADEQKEMLEFIDRIRSLGYVT